MLQLSKKLIPAVFALTALLSPWSLAARQAMLSAAEKPLVVISIAPAKELLADVGYLTETAGAGDVGRLVALMAGPYTAHLNKTQPSGVMVSLEDGVPVSVAFLPVKDLKALLATLEDQLGVAEDAGDGVQEIPTDFGPSLYVKESGAWTFVSNEKEHLADTPKDPAKLLGDLPEKYTLAMRVNVQQIPQDARDMVVGQLREGFEEGLQNDNLPADQAEAIKRLGKTWVEATVRVIEEADELTLGWNVDAAAQKTYLDVSLTALPDSKLAGQMATLKETTSDFAGLLLPDAAAVLHLNAHSSPEEIEQLDSLLTLVREQLMKAIDEDDDLANDEERKAAKDILGQLLDVVAETSKEGRIEGGAVLVLKPDALAVAGGARVADGEKLENALKKLVSFAKEKDRNLERIEFTTSQHQSVQIHTTKVPLNTSREEAKTLLGDPLEVSVGIGKKSAYFSVGKNSTDLLKRVLDKSAEDTEVKLPPAQFSIALTPIVECLAQFDDNPGLFLARESLKASNGNDKIRLQVSPVKNGVEYRIEVQSGVLQVIGAAAQALAPFANEGQRFPPLP